MYSTLGRHCQESGREEHEISRSHATNKVSNAVSPLSASAISQTIALPSPMASAAGPLSLLGHPIPENFASSRADTTCKNPYHCIEASNPVLEVATEWAPHTLSCLYHTCLNCMVWRTRVSTKLPQYMMCPESLKTITEAIGIPCHGAQIEPKPLLHNKMRN